MCIRDRPTTDQQLRPVPRLAPPRHLGQEDGQARLHTPGRPGRQVRVEPGQIGQRLAQLVPVRSPVDGAVEGPPAAAQLPRDRLDGGDVRAAVRVQEPEDELLGPLRPQRPRLRSQPFQILGGTRREAVRRPEHHAQRDVDRSPDRREGLARRGQPVGGHVGDQFQSVRPTGLGRDRVLHVEGDHLQDCTVAHWAHSSGRESCS